MTDALKPRDAKDVEAAVQWAAAGQKALEVVGGGSKRGIGRPSQSDMTLDLSGLSGVTLYEPEELVLSAKAGTPIAEIAALAAAHDQELAFEPMDYAPLLGGAAGSATIGGVIAANLSGPRRIKSGAARDHFLGVTAVSGRGETFKSGGRVVKNVTGYDLCKLLAGSWGTLAAMTDVTLKVLPRAETTQTVLLMGLDDASAAHAMTLAMGSACDVSGAAHLPAALAARMPAVASAGRAVTALRLEGVAPSVAHRRAALETLMRPLGTLAHLADTESVAFWQAVRDVIPFAAGGPNEQRPVWRLSAAPTRGAEIGSRIAAETGGEALYDWAGGLIWVALPPSEDAGAGIVRGALAAGGGGHATLIRAPAAIRAAVAVFQPQDEGMAALSKRVKDGFDPLGLLNAGRMWAGV
jgi:glycolate dehydrogenase FAD-binding subunit